MGLLSNCQNLQKVGHDIVIFNGNVLGHAWHTWCKKGTNRKRMSCSSPICHMQIFKLFDFRTMGLWIWITFILIRTVYRTNLHEGEYRSLCLYYTCQYSHDMTDIPIIVMYLKTRHTQSEETDAVADPGFVKREGRKSKFRDAAPCRPEKVAFFFPEFFFAPLRCNVWDTCHLIHDQFQLGLFPNHDHGNLDFRVKGIVWHICKHSRSPWNLFCRWPLTLGCVLELKPFPCFKMINRKQII